MRKDHSISQHAVAAAELIKAFGDGDEDFNHDLIEGETDLFEAVEMALSEIRECDVIVSGIKNTCEQLNARKARVESRRDRLRGLIDQAFQVAGVKSHTFSCETVSLKNVPPKLIIIDESQVPSKFFKPQPPKLDRKALMDAVKSEPINGAEMSNGGQTIQIRRA